MGDVSAEPSLASLSRASQDSHQRPSHKGGRPPRGLGGESGSDFDDDDNDDDDDDDDNRRHTHGKSIFVRVPKTDLGARRDGVPPPM